MKCRHCFIVKICKMLSSCSLYFLALFLGTINCNLLETNEISKQPKASQIVQSLIILKPQNDSCSRDYKSFKLGNGLTVILVSDKNFENAAVSLSVPAGYFQNPPEVPGLAHLLEHSIYLGSVDYPEENRFQRWISENGGTYDGETQEDFTLFYYSTSVSKFNDSLNSFASLFTSPPLLSNSALERAAHNINSEYRISLGDENWKFLRLFKQGANPGHPIHNFAEGNYQTLWKNPIAKGINLRKSVLKFYDHYYSSNLMNLVVAGPQSFDQLQKLVQKEFGDIPNRNKPKPTRTRKNPFQKNEFAEMINARIDSIYGPRLILVFPMEYNYKYQRNALDYVIFLLNDQNNGSLVTWLKREDLASAILVEKLEYSHFTNLEVNVFLTPFGLENVNYLIYFFYQYIKMLKESQRIEHEILWNLFFEPKSKAGIFSAYSTPSDIANELSGRMTIDSVYKILFAGGSDPFPKGSNAKILKGISDVLEKLKPRNCRVFVTSDDCCGNATTHLEPFYGIKYTRNRIDEAFLKLWESCDPSSNFYLPFKNIAISPLLNKSTSTSTCYKGKEKKKPARNSNINGKLPQLLFNSSSTEIWYLFDKEKEVSAQGNIITPVASMNPKNANLNELYVVLMGFNNGFYNLTPTATGMKVKVEGFQNNTMEWAKLLPPLFPPTLLLYKKLIVESYESQMLKESSPCDKASWDRGVLLKDGFWSYENLIEGWKDVEDDDLLNYAHEFGSRMRFVWYFQGNLEKNKTLELAKIFQSYFKNAAPLNQDEMKAPRKIKLPRGSYYRRNKENREYTISCSEVVFLMGADDSSEGTVLRKILVQIGDFYAYDIMRTKENLGYGVDMKHNCVDYEANCLDTGILVYVKGDVDPQIVDSRITAFLWKFKTILENMDQGTFARYKSVVKEDVISQKVSFADEIFSGRLNFKRIEMELDAIERITKRDLLKFYYDKMLSPSTRRRLSVLIKGQTDLVKNYSPFKPSNVTEIEDVLTWKENMLKREF